MEFQPEYIICLGIFQLAMIERSVLPVETGWYLYKMVVPDFPNGTKSWEYLGVPKGSSSLEFELKQLVLKRLPNHLEISSSDLELVSVKG